MKKKTLLIFQIIITIALVLLLWGGWSTERQSLANTPFFWAPNRIINGIGVLFLIIGWWFWDVYSCGKRRQIWKCWVSFSSLLIATVLINGVLGITGGSVALAFVAARLLVVRYWHSSTQQKKVVA